MLTTALAHFNDDVNRARALIAHAQPQADGMLKDDILRAAWMMGVGACDAYFSDAYADFVSRAIRAKEIDPAIPIPDRLNNLKIPVTAILRQANDGWRWRMAARELIEDENVLSLDKIRMLFNHFFRKGHKIINQDTIESWMLHPNAKSRLFSITPTDYRKLNASQKGKVRKEALGKFQDRFEGIFQRRHDCIHNCDRLRVAPQNITDTAVTKIVEDIESLVLRCQEAFLNEFPFYLSNLGFNAVTRNRVGV